MNSHALPDVLPSKYLWFFLFSLLVSVVVKSSGRHIHSVVLKLHAGLVCVTLVKVSLGTVSWGAKCCVVLQFHWLFVLWDENFSKTCESPVFIRHLWSLPTGRAICWSYLPGLKSEERGWVLWLGSAGAGGWSLKAICHGHLRDDFCPGSLPQGNTRQNQIFTNSCLPSPLLMMHDGPLQRWHHEGMRWVCFIKMFDLCCGVITVGSLHLENCVFWISPRAILPCRSARINIHVMKVQLRQGYSLYCYLAVFWK